MVEFINGENSDNINFTPGISLGPLIMTIPGLWVLLILVKSIRLFLYIVCFEIKNFGLWSRPRNWICGKIGSVNKTSTKVSISAKLRDL